VLAERLLNEGEELAAIVCMSPLMQIAKAPKLAHPNIRSDAMFCAKAFDAFVDLIVQAAQRHIVDGRPEEIYEPLDHAEPGLPRTLIHVSGSEVLLRDARLAAQRLAAVGVPVQLRVWPGQMHVFQIAAPMVPEADRSLVRGTRRPARRRRCRSHCEGPRCVFKPVHRLDGCVVGTERPDLCQIACITSNSM
jgi:acetyl esterase/lipase